MNDKRDTKDRPLREVPTPTASAILSDGSMVEMLYRAEQNRTLFAVSCGGNVREETAISDRGEKFVPYSARNNLLAHEVILFPSEATDYESEAVLLEDIRTFIHAYADVSPLFEQIASHYVLFSWVYDSFNELPYLRVRGDTGSGKTRCLLTIGSICYKPMFASGASTISPIFRILDSFRGTLIVDEADFRFSDAKAEVIKILNNGNARGFPVLRTESVNSKEFDPRAYSVFGPKMIATRGPFEDRALEMRCLTEETGGRELRADIPLNLGDEWKSQALQLRNKLLMFRFRNFGKREIDPGLFDRRIEPRLSQLFGPLLSVVESKATRDRLCDLAHAYHQELIDDRATDTEAELLEVIRDLLAAAHGSRIAVKDITREFRDRFGDEYDRRVTAKWIGSVVRKSLQLKTQKSNGVYVLSDSERPKLARLYEKYGVTPDAPTPGELFREADSGATSAHVRI